MHMQSAVYSDGTHDMPCRPAQESYATRQMTDCEAVCAVAVVRCFDWCVTVETLVEVIR